MRNILASSPSPIQMMEMGIQAMGGMGRMMRNSGEQMAYTIL